MSHRPVIRTIRRSLNGEEDRLRSIGACWVSLRTGRGLLGGAPQPERPVGVRVGVCVAAGVRVEVRVGVDTGVVEVAVRVLGAVPTGVRVGVCVAVGVEVGGAKQCGQTR